MQNIYCTQVRKMESSISNSKFKEAKWLNLNVWLLLQTKTYDYDCKHTALGTVIL